ncbi:MAG TPA: hypothetical protein QF753_15370 [Victivallales bacterium]|nr:hypothetical protein [Victivallales bacterium]
MATLKIKLEIKPNMKEHLEKLYKKSIEKYSKTGEPVHKTNYKVYKAVIQSLKDKKKDKENK